MNSNFDNCLDFVLIHEGGYVNDPNDPGGRTIYGISEKAHPEAWAQGTPTKEQAKQIYKEKYWDIVKGDELPEGLDLAVFDAAVNMGTKKAIQMLQQLVGLKSSDVDGVMGDKTLKQIKLHFANSYNLLRLEHYSFLVMKFPNLARYEKGWNNRVNDLEGYIKK